MSTTNTLDLNNRISVLEKDVTSAENDLKSLDRIVAIPFTTPSDLSSTGVGDSVHIGLTVNVPQNAYIVGVSIRVFGQERTIVGEYFGQAGCLSNYVFLINLLKAIPSAYNNISGHLIVCVPHN